MVRFAKISVYCMTMGKWLEMLLVFSVLSRVGFEWMICYSPIQVGLWMRLFMGDRVADL